MSNSDRATVGLRDLRQDASELVRRVESGEEIEITVSGRLAARLVPPTPRRWQQWTDIADLFAGRQDPDWDADRNLVDQRTGSVERDNRLRAGSMRQSRATMRAILDTSVVIATDVAPLDGELAISAVTLADLQFGVLVTTDANIRAERLRRLSQLERTFDALPIDTDVATSYGELAAALVASGREPPARAMDLLIAATARAHSTRLYTRYASDLTGIEHLLDIVIV
jgi:toxin FitB